MFSFYLTHSTANSFIDFNGYLIENILDHDENNIIWLDTITPDFYWSVYCEGISFGHISHTSLTQENAFKFGQSSYYVFFDTGANYI